jgi:hypothetical protein
MAPANSGTTKPAARLISRLRELNTMRAWRAKLSDRRLTEELCSSRDIKTNCTETELRGSEERPGWEERNFHVNTCTRLHQTIRSIYNLCSRKGDKWQSHCREPDSCQAVSDRHRRTYLCKNHPAHIDSVKSEKARKTLCQTGSADTIQVKKEAIV